MNYFRQAKVANFNETVSTAGAVGSPHSLSDEDVRRLQVAMKHSFVVGGFNARHYLAEDCDGALNV
jgi:hypothetical protein